MKTWPKSLKDYLAHHYQESFHLGDQDTPPPPTEQQRNKYKTWLSARDHENRMVMIFLGISFLISLAIVAVGVTLQLGKETLLAATGLTTSLGIISIRFLIWKGQMDVVWAVIDEWEPAETIKLLERINRKNAKK
ncbi:MAG: hypothetical protein H7839_19845 [Magnetococcus sp. YQC-5]